MWLKYRHILIFLCFYPLVYGIYYIFYDYLKIINLPLVQLLISIVAILFIKKFGKNWVLFNKLRLSGPLLSLNLSFLIIILLLLFAVNNVLIMNYDNTVDWRNEYNTLSTYSMLFRFVLGSTSEEVIYRGFVQNFVNNISESKNQNLISKGNVIGTLLMTFIHIGFFWYFDILFAISSLFLVVFFSLISGFLMDKTKNLILPILLHILVNFIHYFVCISMIKFY